MEEVVSPVYVGALEKKTRSFAQGGEWDKIANLRQTFPWLTPEVVLEDLRVQKTEKWNGRINYAALLVAAGTTAEALWLGTTNGQWESVMVMLVTAGVSVSVALIVTLRTFPNPVGVACEKAQEEKIDVIAQGG